MSITTVRTGYPLTMTTGNQAGGWPTKKAAVTDLGTLREQGFNCERDIEVNQTYTNLFRFWVISRPDHYNVTTSLMTRAGAWLLGRLTDATPCYHEPRCKHGHPALWTPLRAELTPATFTHVTRTVLDPSRTERYKTKSNGSCGRWVTPDESIALCTCGWKAYESTRAQAQASARVHRKTAPPTAAPAP